VNATECIQSDSISYSLGWSRSFNLSPHFPETLIVWQQKENPSNNNYTVFLTYSKMQPIQSFLLNCGECWVNDLVMDWFLRPEETDPLQDHWPNTLLHRLIFVCITFRYSKVIVIKIWLPQQTFFYTSTDARYPYCYETLTSQWAKACSKSVK